ncbi:MAG: nucleotide exchange factor GrpE [Chitinivibrionales bacterium]|nr:nucleotide exchange factor GrpE [Chitinivibrionales bacterium]
MSINSYEECIPPAADGKPDEGQTNHREQFAAVAELIRTRCNKWFAETGINSDDASVSKTVSEEADLYSIYEQLLAVRMDQRKIAKKTHESLDHLQEVITTAAAEGAAATSPGSGSCVSVNSQHLIELHQRFERLTSHLAVQPNERFSFSQKGWKRWAESITDGFNLVHTHLNQLLHAARIQRIKTVGEQFDPYVMIAIERRHSPGAATGVVLEEISSGYRHLEAVIKLAEVVVCSNKEGEK